MILDNIFWRFGHKKYGSYNDFIKEAKDYNEILAPEREWNPNEKLIPLGKILIQYKADWKEDGNEELEIEIKAGDGKILKMGEILYALNNQSVDFFKDEEFSYFQGLIEDDMEEEPPVFKMKISD